MDDQILDYISERPPKEQDIFLYLHNILMHCPGMTCKLKYKIPFYYRKSWICYLNPLKSGGVELAFTRANELADEQGALDFKSRKQVAGIEYCSVKELNDGVLTTLLNEAILLDDTIPYQSKRKGNDSNADADLPLGEDN